MDSKLHFDRIARTLATSETRRGMLRLLGGGSLSVGLGVAATPEAEAARKVTLCHNGRTIRVAKPAVRRHLRHGDSRGACRCPQGKRIVSLLVPANGDTVTTPILLNRTLYRLRVSGAVRSNAATGIDAEYAFSFANPTNSPVDVGSVDYGLSIDGNQPEWGSFDPDHVYEKLIWGTGRPLSLRVLDGKYSDNSGTLTVEVFCA